MQVDSREIYIIEQDEIPFKSCVKRKKGLFTFLTYSYSFFTPFYRTAKPREGRW